MVDNTVKILIEARGSLTQAGYPIEVGCCLMTPLNTSQPLF